MKLRIKFIESIGYFTQVKHGLFSPWKKIGKHFVGYGLYDEECLDHPMVTQHEALERARLYEQWFVNARHNTTYTDI